MKHLALSAALAILLLAACSAPKPATAPDTSVIEQRDLDTMMVTAPRMTEEDPEPEAAFFALPRYNPSHKRTHDLLHTKLDLKFNWEKEEVIGIAELELTPYFYTTDRLVLDAKNFEIASLRLKGASQGLKYENTGTELIITLDRPYKKGEKYTLLIAYTARPNETGGSAAITSDKGLFFINPRGEDGDKPQQIWTQGETENNSRWFPTVDKPNERCTQEMYLTVEDKYKTLSNGLLLSSKKNPDGTRTDYWKMDKPHAPYLFMLAVGEFAVVKDTWEGIPLEYYVEPEYEAHAKAIFAHTPEMLSFFSQKLGLKYPWAKYSQIVVRDYVSGAMENTTGVIFGEFVQRTTRELIDNHNDKIVAHELFHHWFGDYVTCESWANLTMNEGFANYSEYMWLEHKYGADEADYHLLEEWGGYLNSTQNGGAHPLIHFGYDDKEQMFDAHSYNKGGAVLHMLRNYLGDEAFFASLNRYLTDNAYTAVEVHNLRLAVEATVGEDMNWFFDQWFLSKGHPTLEVSYGYDEATKVATVTVAQTQDPEEGYPAIFELPVAIDIYAPDGQKQRHQVRVNERVQTFTFPAAQKPALINFDADKMVLGVRTDQKTEEELVFQYRTAPKFLDRFEALQGLASGEGNGLISLTAEILNDKSWVIRSSALSFLDADADEALIAQARKMATDDPHSEVRQSALAKLAELNDDKAVDIATDRIGKDQAYTVVGTALQVLQSLEPFSAAEYAKKLENEPVMEIIDAVGGIYAETEDPVHIPFFERNLEKMQGYGAITFYDNYQGLLSKSDLGTAAKGADKLKAIAMNMGQSPWRRIAATRAVFGMRDEYAQQAEQAQAEERKSGLTAMSDSLTAMLTAIKAAETNAQLKAIYEEQF